MRTQILSLLTLLCSSVQALPQVSPTSPEPAHNGLKVRDSRRGVWLINKSKINQTYNFYNSKAHGNGWGSIDYDNPMHATTIERDGEAFVPLGDNFKGIVQRGELRPATLGEIQMVADGVHDGVEQDHLAHANVSLQMGCDGAVTITDTSGDGITVGFTEDILTGDEVSISTDDGVKKVKIPKEQRVKKDDGLWTLSPQTKVFGGVENPIVTKYLQAVVGQPKAYIVGIDGTDVVFSKIYQFNITFY